MKNLLALALMGTAYTMVEASGQTTSITPEISLEEPAGTELAGVMVWGLDSHGQFEVPVAAQSGVIGIAAGGSGTIYAIRNDGSVVAWGNNTYFQTQIPSEIQSGVKAIAVNRWQTVALKQDGRVFQWGAQFINSTTSGYATAGYLQSHPSSVVAIAGWGDWTTVLMSGGKIFSYLPGSNTNAVYGYPHQPPSSTVAIAISGGFILELLNDGRVVKTNPVFGGVIEILPPGSGVNRISANAALKHDGSVVSLEGRPLPPELQSGVWAIDTGGSGSMAVKKDGSVVVWEAGTGVTQDVPVAARSGITDVAVGSGVKVALKNGLLPVDFGRSPVSVTSETKTITVRNKGGAPLALSGVELAGEPLGDFQIVTSGMVSPVPAGGTTTFSVAFTPSSVGPREALLRVLNDDPNEGILEIRLTGRGTSGEISVMDPNGNSLINGVAMVDFGPHPINTAGLTKTCTISNSGAGPLLVTDLALAQATPEFVIDTGGMLSSIPAGGSTSFRLGFHPKATGRRPAVLRLSSSDMDESSFEIVLAGTGQAPEISVEDADGIVQSGVVAWGLNDYGQATVPEAAKSDIVALAAGNYHSLALSRAGRVIAWGRNDKGQTNVPEAALSGVTAVAAGHNQSMALKNGKPIIWGPLGGPQVPLAAQSGVAAISMHDDHSIALKMDGSVVDWGSFLGFAGSVPATAQSGVTAIAAGAWHSLALKEDGTVVTWGLMSNGQISKAAYVPADAQSGVIAIAATGYESVALKIDGRVIVWGYEGERFVPAAAKSGITNITTNESNILALKNDGTTLIWGMNWLGQLTLPPEAQSGCSSISAGGNRFQGSGCHFMALKNGLGPMPFGSWEMGTASFARSFTIRNTGSSPLQLSGVSLVGTDSADFILDTAQMLTEVPDGGQTIVKITFAPTSIGSKAATLRLNSNDANEGTLDLRLTGEGTGQSVLQMWRQTWFGSMENTGDAADDADGDHDGLSNLIEFAFGLDPTESSAGQLPAVQLKDGNLLCRFTHAGGNSISYGAEWSSSLIEESWTDIPDTGNFPNHVFTLPTGEQGKKFIRLKVTKLP